MDLIKVYYLKNVDFCNFSAAFLFSSPSNLSNTCLSCVASCCLQGSTHPLSSCLFQVPQRSLRAAIFSESVLLCCLPLVYLQILLETRQLISCHHFTFLSLLIRRSTTLFIYINMVATHLPQDSRFL